MIPADAAAAIAQAAGAGGFDADALAREAHATSATIAIPLVAALTARVEAIDAGAARYVHWGATSQDIVGHGDVAADRSRRRSRWRATTRRWRQRCARCPTITPRQ